MAAENFVSKPLNPPATAATAATSTTSRETVTLNITNAETLQFTYDDLRLATKNFSISRFLGAGGFGNVYRGNLDSIKQEVAVKRLDLTGHQGTQEFISEVQTLSNIRHKNIVQLIGYCNEKDYKLVVYELMRLGSLEGFLFESPSGKRSGVLDWKTRVEIGIQIAEAVHYLHNTANPAIIHRDLKCSNVLLGDGPDGYKAKLSDFGLAILGPTDDEKFIQTNPQGTIGYSDPLYITTSRLTFKSEIYSFGILLLELISGKRCFEERISSNKQYLIEWAKPAFNDMDKFRADFVDPLLEGKYPVAELEKLVAIIASCVEVDPNDRPTIGSIVQSLKGITSQSDKQKVQELAGSSF